MDEGITKKTRYDELRSSLIEKEPEVEKIKMDVPSKEMLKIYEKNTDLFLEKLGKNLDEFDALLEEYDDYKKMFIVQKMLLTLDSYEPLLMNITQEKEFLFSKLKEIGAQVKEEEKEVKRIEEKNAPEFADDKEKAMVALRKGGMSLRDIEKFVDVPFTTIGRILREKMGGEYKEENMPDT